MNQNKVLYNFSDGGIIALLLAATERQPLSIAEQILDVVKHVQCLFAFFSVVRVIMTI